MPELPEVETVVRTLAPRITGQKIVGVRLMRSDIVEPDGIDLAGNLSGHTVQSISRRGKRIIITLDDANRFYIHLGMTGRLTMEKPAEAIALHTHLVVEFKTEEMRFRDPRRFGGVWWLGDSAIDEGMGPEPLTLQTSELADRLKKTNRPIKNALMDQGVIAGLGNIYVDESLFRARIHPLRKANRLKLPEIEKLNRSIKATLLKAISHRGSTLRDYVDSNGEAGSFQNRHSVYDRAGKDCRNCKTAIKRIVLGGRSTHFCPECQPRARSKKPAPPGRR